MSVTKALFSLAVLVALGAADNPPFHGYYDQCFQTNILGTAEPFLILESNCNTPPMGPPWICSQLDLNHCIENHKGTMQQGSDIVNGKTPGFGGSCDNCELNGSVLSCDCQNVHNSKQRSSIDTNDIIMNDNGYLTCVLQKGQTVTADKCPPDQ
ncbi:Cyanovirin-N [Xylariaceae sp. FL0016]|nr:Cyanovirin-N [Xylariaceae sp. FL0016]